jgi:hypothetical protein
MSLLVPKFSALCFPSLSLRMPQLWLTVHVRSDAPGGPPWSAPSPLDCLYFRRRQNLCQSAWLSLRDFSSRGCREQETRQGADTPATEGDRKGATIGCRAWDTRPAVPCDSRCRCTQRRTPLRYEEETRALSCRISPKAGSEASCDATRMRRTVRSWQASALGSASQQRPCWPGSSVQPIRQPARAAGQRCDAESRRWGSRRCTPVDTEAKILFAFPIRLRAVVVGSPGHRLSARRRTRARCC